MSELKDMCPRCCSTEKVWMERSPDGCSKCVCGYEGPHTDWIKPQRVLDKVTALIKPKLSDLLLKAAEFKRKSYPLGIDIAAQEYFDTLNFGAEVENARLFELIRAIQPVLDAAEDAVVQIKDQRGLWPAEVDTLDEAIAKAREGLCK